MIVLDSSAMLAYLHGETGGEIVQALLLDEERDVPVWAHAVNLCEVFYDALGSHGMSVAEAAIATLREAGVIERNDCDTAFWRDIAAIISTQRTSGHKLALGDAFGVALARREGADFMTADRSELQHVAAAGLCGVSFIR